LWRACCKVVVSMLRPPSKHQMQGWWTVGRASDFFPIERVLYIYRIIGLIIIEIIHPLISLKTVHQSNKSYHPTNNIQHKF
jgi:hypothetical protein